ncbi:MAG: UDP-N-acetylmuramoyl-tripeptide--D-alanyl-D-alanine ligase [Planctomycetes bacterium]|nr:UDP-N-acetylmuramoyl-tripeptide--D-alanyl-D-alanine ligase [Planctomycetota bacterium]
MKPTAVEKIAEVLDAEVIGDANGQMVTGVCTDSRLVKAGDCFFAIKGQHFDGHDHVADAFDKGAVCAVISKDAQASPAATIKVGDTVKALGDLARWYRNELRCEVIAITGSAGKTTTREMLFHALSADYKCHQAEKSFNNAIGVPLTILSADQSCEIVIAELGSNSPGEILYLTKIAQPSIAVVTNIFPAHLEGLGSIAGITKEKASISEGVKAGGELIINGDFRDIVDHYKQNGTEFTSFGMGVGCDIRAEGISTKGAVGKLIIGWEKISVNAAGRGNCENALCAWAVCKSMSIAMKKFAVAMASFQQISMRLEIETFGSVTVINDCYNANPASMLNALECLCDMAKRKKRRAVFVCGSMAELGDRSQELHETLGMEICQKNADVLIAAGPFAQAVAEGAEKSGNNDLQVYVFDETDQLCDNLGKIVAADDIVLVKGSRSMKLEQAVDRLRSLFG